MRIFKAGLTCLLLVSVSGLVACGNDPANLVSQSAASAPYKAFEHTVTATNAGPSSSLLDNPLYPELNDPNTKLIISQKVNFSGFSSTPENDHPVGIYFNPFDNAWRIINTDGGAMPVGARFNVLILNDSENSFTHQFTGTAASDAILDHPKAADANAKIFITPVYSTTAPISPDQTSVRFSLFIGTGSRWTLRREAAAGFSLNEKFNIYIASATDLAARFVSPVDTFSLNLFSSPEANFNGLHFISNDTTNVAGFVDKNFNVADINGGVIAIRNQDGLTQIQSNEAFNVLTVFN